MLTQQCKTLKTNTRCRTALWQGYLRRQDLPGRHRAMRKLRSNTSWGCLMRTWKFVAAKAWPHFAEEQISMLGGVLAGSLHQTAWPRRRQCSSDGNMDLLFQGAGCVVVPNCSKGDCWRLALQLWTAAPMHGANGCQSGAVCRPTTCVHSRPTLLHRTAQRQSVTPTLALKPVATSCRKASLCATSLPPSASCSSTAARRH